MILVDLIAELLEIDFDTIKKEPSVQGKRFLINDLIPSALLQELKGRNIPEKCIHRYIENIIIFIFHDIIIINNIVIPKEEFLQSDENYLILKYGKILTKELF